MVRFVPRYILLFGGPELFRAYALIAILLSLLTLPVIRSLVPWFYAANTSVQVKLNVPVDTDMELCWDKAQQECLPLVAESVSNDGRASRWLTELPPRPVYHLTLILRSWVNQAVLKGLILEPQPFTIFLLGTKGVGAAHEFTPSASNAEAQNVELNRVGDRWYLTAAPGGKLHVIEPITPGPPGKPVWNIAGFLWSLFVGIWLVVGGLGLPLLRREKATTAIVVPKLVNGTRILWLAFALASTFHLLIVVNSPVQFDQYDAIDYIRHANTLVEHREYTSLNRLPGYPVLLAIFFWVCGYHLSTVALLQAIMFDGAVFALAYSLRSRLHPLTGAFAIFVAILSPVQVINSAWIMSESSFATFAVFSIAALFNHLSSQGFKSKVWLFIYAVSVTVAFLIRPNGVVLFAALIPVCVPSVWNSLWQADGWRDKIKSAFCDAVPYLAAVMVLVTVVLGWLVRSYFYYDHFMLSTLSGHVRVQRLLFSGIFDARGLLNRDCPVEKRCTPDLWPIAPLYKDFIIGRLQHPDWDMTFGSMRPSIDRMLSTGSLTPNKQFQISKVLEEVGEITGDLIPWQARTIGTLRAVWAGFGWRSLQGSFSISSLDSTTYQRRRALLDSEVGGKFVYDERGGSRLVSLYSNIVSGYRWYMPLWLAAVLSGLVMIWRGQPLLACPLFVFIANGIFYICLLRTAELRYIQVFDTFLIFQCALGLSVLCNFRPFMKRRELQNEPQRRLDTLVCAKAGVRWI
jgi:hypothetical protein